MRKLTRIFRHGANDCVGAFLPNEKFFSGKRKRKHSRVLILSKLDKSNFVKKIIIIRSIASSRMICKDIVRVVRERNINLIEKCHYNGLTHTSTKRFEAKFLSGLKNIRVYLSNRRSHSSVCAHLKTL